MARRPWAYCPGSRQERRATAQPDSCDAAGIRGLRHLARRVIQRVVTRSFHGTGLSGEGLVAGGSMTPAGGWDISNPEPKPGGCFQLATRLKSTVPPENSAPAKPTVPPGNSASEKLTVPPENPVAGKKTVPPEVPAPVTVGPSPVNLEWAKSTSAPENL